MTADAPPSTEHPAEDIASVKRWLPLLVAASLFMEQLDSTIVNTAIPAMAANLHVTPLSLKAVASSYIVSLAVGIPVSGWLADRFGTKRIFTLAVAIFTMASVLCGLALNVPMLVASRMLQGLGAAMMTPVGRIAIVRTFPKFELLAALNFITLPALIGPLLGPTVGGVLVELVSWRFIFFINVPVGLIALWMIRRHMPDYRAAIMRPLDVVGLVLFGSGAALLSWLLEIFGEHTLDVTSTGLLLLVSLALLGAYGWHAQSAPYPLLKLVLFKVRTYRIAVLGGFITRLGVGGLPFLLPLLYQIGFGLPAWQSGLMMMPTAAAAMFMKVMSPKVLRRWGYRRVLTTNTLLMGFTITLYGALGPNTPLALIVLLSLTQGLFNSLQFSSMNSMTYADVEDADSSMASTMASSMQQMSLSFGLAFGSLITGWFLGNVDQSHRVEMTRALHHAFITLGVLTALSSLVFRTLRSNDGASVSQYVRPAAQAETQRGELA